MIWIACAANGRSNCSRPWSMIPNPNRSGTHRAELDGRCCLATRPRGCPARSSIAVTGGISIPMKLGTDSLNVMVAAGIFLHQFTQ